MLRGQALRFEGENIELLYFRQIILIALTLWLVCLIIIRDHFLSKIGIFLLVVKRLRVFLTLRFIVKSLLFYYYCFECSLLPVFIIILGWGYQPERMGASLYILFYTITASLPLLIVLLVLGKELGTSEICLTALGGYVLHTNLAFILVAAFIVKFPLYASHLWLPKAHVEAPVSGSMVLAGVLLKLGGYGLLIISRLILSIGFTRGFLFRVALIGRGGLAVIILRIVDLKVAIAYSSVVHIGIIIAVFLSVRGLGLIGGVWILLAHGFTSSGIFRGANMMYERRHSRRLVNNKGVLRAAPFFSTAWFILIVLNFAGPFTLNLFSEILIIQSIIRVSLLTCLPIAILCFFSAAYNLNIYASSQQGVIFRGRVRIKNLVSREIMILSFHVYPCILFLMVLNILISSINNT